MSKLQFILPENLPEMVKSPTGNRPQKEDTNIFELQKKFGRSQIEVPNWQRGVNKWSPTKQELYIRDLIEAAMGSDVTRHVMPLPVLLYTEKNKVNSKPYLNDGLQRVSNAKTAYERLSEKYGHDTAQELLERIKVSTVTYDFTNEEAIEQFRKVNQGTPLSDGQLSATILAQHPRFLEWKPFITKNAEMIREIIKVTGIAKVNDNQKVLKSFSNEEFQREVMCLMYRWISGTKSRVPIEFLPNHLRGNSQAANGNLIEECVLRIMDVPMGKASLRMEDLRALLMSRAAVWRDQLNRVVGPEYVLNPSVAKFLMTVTVHYANNDVPAGIQNEWCKALIKHVKEHSGLTIKKENGRNSVTNMRSRDLADLSRAEQSVKQFEYESPADPGAPAELKGRKSHANHLREGYDNSHENPVAAKNVDDGKIKPEPASANRSRGSKPIGKKVSIPAAT